MNMDVNPKQIIFFLEKWRFVDVSEGKVIYLNEMMEGSGLHFEPIQEPKKVQLLNIVYR